MVKSEEFSALKFYKKRLVSVVLPYILWVVVYYAYTCIAGNFRFNLRELLYYICTGELAGHLYFVIALVQLYLLMPLWIRLYKNVSPYIMIPLSLMISIISDQYLSEILLSVFGFEFPFANRVFARYLFFWTVGAYIGLNYEKAKEILRTNRKFIYISFGIIAPLALMLSYYDSAFDKGMDCINSVMLLYKMAAVLCLFTVSLGKVKNVCKTKVVSILDKSTYNIYLCHILVINIVNGFMGAIGICDMKARYAVRFLAVYAISVGFCMLYTYAKEKLKSKRQKI